MATMSLRECALHDAMLYYGMAAVEACKKKQKQRKWNKRPGKKTNVGDPNPSGNSVAARKG